MKPAGSSSSLNGLLLEAWQKVTQELFLQLGEEEYRRWIAPLSLQDIRRGEVLLQAPSRRHADGLAARAGKALRENFSAALGVPVEVRILAPVPTAADLRQSLPHLAYQVEHEGNRMACRALKGIAESSHDPRFNPLYLWGREGVGKTFLVRRVLLNDRSEGGIYTSSQDFIDDLARSWRRHGSISPFRERMLGTRLLILDEVHRLKGKPRAQAELIHLIKVLLSRRARIVLCGRYSPRDIRRLDRSLLSMLLSGLTIEIKPPPETSRLELLLGLERAAGEPHLPPVLLQDLAARLKSGFGPLREAWIRLRQSGVQPGNREEAADMVNRVTAGKDALDRLVGRVANHFGVDLAELISPKRARRISFARQVAAYAALERGFSLSAVGERMGGRSRSTISYMRQKIRRARRIDPVLDRLLEDLL